MPAMTPDLLTIRVDFRDEQAAARITPEQANAYLAARGWDRYESPGFHVWQRDDTEPLVQVLVPNGQHWHDYGRRMVDVLNGLARIEGRSVLAIFVDVVATATGHD